MACDGLEPEDVPTADGVNVILEYTGGKLSRVNMKRNFSMPWRDTFYGPGRKKGERPP